MSEQRPNSGIVNPNKYARAGSRAPHYNGRGELTCKHCGEATQFEIAIWDRRTLMTMAFTEKSLAEQRRAEAKARKAGLPLPGAAQPETETTTEAEPKEGDTIY